MMQGLIIRLIICILSLWVFLLDDAMGDQSNVALVATSIHPVLISA